MLILASSSQNRQQALTIAKIPFKAVAADIDEKAIQDVDVRVRIVKIARAKVEAVAKHHHGVILGADGMNLVGGKIFEKPESRAEAVRMIEAQSGQKSSFLTAYFILNTQTGKTYQGLVESFYQFRVLTLEEIEDYVGSEPVYNWAAAFSPINSSALRFVEWMEGSVSQFCYSMPFEKIIPILKREKII